MLLIVLLLLQLPDSSNQLLYIQSDDSSTYCPNQLCITLDQVEFHLIPGATFVFLPGNHSLQTQINLTNIIYDITFKGKNTEAMIVCNGGSISCLNVSSLVINELIFVLQSKTKLHAIDSSFGAVK